MNGRIRPSLVELFGLFTATPTLRKDNKKPADLAVGGFRNFAEAYAPGDLSSSAAITMPAMIAATARIAMMRPGPPSSFFFSAV